MAGYDESLYRMYLSSVPMFAHCSQQQLDLVAGAVRPTPIRTDTTSCRRAAPATGSSSSPAARRGSIALRRDVAELGPGDYFGELSLFDPAPATRRSPRPRRSRAWCSRPTCPGEALDRIPAVRDTILHGMAHRIHELDERY